MKNVTKAILYNKGIYVNVDAGMPNENPDMIFKLAADYFSTEGPYVLDCETKTVYTYSRESSVTLDKLMRFREISVYLDGCAHPTLALIDTKRLDEIVNSIKTQKLYKIKMQNRFAKYSMYEAYGYAHDVDEAITYIMCKKKEVIRCICDDYDAIEILEHR